MIIENGRIKKRTDVSADVVKAARHEAVWGSLADLVPVGTMPEADKVVEAAGYATCGDISPASEQD